MQNPSDPFWKRKTLAELSVAEWESLCDGCGKCCTQPLEDDETGEFFSTNIACRLFDSGACACGDYANRWASVPECIKLTADNVDEMDFLPASCAYRLVAAGKDLPDWHHLVCGDRAEIHRRGFSVRDRTISETHVSPDEYEDFIVTWPDGLAARGKGG